MGGKSDSVATAWKAASHSECRPHDKLFSAGEIRGCDSSFLGSPMKSSSTVADFDSATGMLRALANYLKGEEVVLLGAMPPSRLPVMNFVAAVVNSLPSFLREQVYIWS